MIIPTSFRTEFSLHRTDFEFDKHFGYCFCLLFFSVCLLSPRSFRPWAVSPFSLPYNLSAVQPFSPPPVSISILPQSYELTMLQWNGYAKEHQMVHVRTEVVAKTTSGSFGHMEVGRRWGEGRRSRLPSCGSRTTKIKAIWIFAAKCIFKERDGRRVEMVVVWMSRLDAWEAHCIQPTLSDSLFSPVFGCICVCVCVPFLWNFSRLAIISFYLHLTKL